MPLPPSEKCLENRLAIPLRTIPSPRQQMVRYYGYYSNVCRGKRKKQNQDGLVPCVLKPEEDSKSYRKNWARV